MGKVTAVLVSAKIGPVHLGRDAYVYVRQSTLTQLREDTESLIRQNELRERAVALGWDAHQARVIDADLGRSERGRRPRKASGIWCGPATHYAATRFGW